MKYEAEIPFGDDYIYVDIEFEVEWVDNSFSYSYGSIDGVYDPGSGYDIVDYKYDIKEYTFEEQNAIDHWIEKERYNILKKLV